MKICYLANAGSIHTQRWLRFFAEKGHDVHVISYEVPSDNVDGVVYHIIPTNKKFLYISLLYKCYIIKNVLDSIRPDIVHAHYISKYGVIGSLLNISPLVMSAWGSDVLLNTKYRALYNMGLKYILSNADLITCDGENSKKAMIDLDINPNKIKIIYHGVDTKQFSPNSRDRKVIADLFGKGDHPVVISARALDSRGNLETLIYSIPYVLEEVPEAKFIICGSGPDETNLKKLSDSLNLSESIRYIGHVSHELLPKYIASSDVYVSTSLLDGGVAVSTLDAMACGVAVIATDVADNAKWIINNQRGFIIPTKSPEILAEKIIYLINNNNIRLIFGHRCRDVIKMKQDYSTNMAAMEVLYEGLVLRGSI